MIAAPSPASGGNAPHGLVCIVEDDESVADSLRVFLETYDFQIAVFASGMSFLADRRHCEAGCLVIDYHMPGMNGLDVVAELRREGRCPPTILVTGRLDDAIAERARRAAIAGVLEKPLRVATLVGMIRGILANR